MKKFKSEIVWSAAFIALALIAAAAAFNFFNNLSYAFALKIPDVWTVSAVKQNWGEPSDIAADEETGSVKLYYDGFYVLSDKSAYDRRVDEAAASAFFIYGDSLKFTSRKIGVGSSKEDVLSLYEGRKTELKDCGEMPAAI